jgi:NodT family efflux transporter outer membrane factor (OMF) lipoprotein
MSCITIAGRIYLVGELLCLVLLQLVGCSPAIMQPAAPVTMPAHFSMPGKQVLPEKWWTAFQDPVLDELVARSLAGNFDLRTAWDRLHQAEAIARQAGAELWPTLDAQAGAAHTWNSGDNSSTDDDTFSANLRAGYEVDLWGRLGSLRDAAVLDARASRSDLQTAALTLSAEVSSTWYQLVEQYGQLDLLIDQLAINEQVLDLVTLRFRRGQVGAADVLQQRELVASIQGQKALVKGQVQTLAHQLAVLLGLSPKTKVAPRIARFGPLPPLPQTGVPAALLRRRPDLQSAYFGIMAADRRVAAAIADRFPRLDLTAEAGSFSGEASALFDGWLATLAANIAGPVFDGGRRRAEVERTRAVASERIHAYGQTILAALREVEDALTQERRQREYIATLDQQLALAAKVVDRVRDRYIRGQENYLRVLDALLTHQSLQRSRLSAQLQLVQVRIDLCRALAGSWKLKQPEGTGDHPPAGDTALQGARGENDARSS